MNSIDLIDIENLPENESQIYEYKSSRTSIDKLKLKMSVAASAFTNAGGGFFIAGVDDTGKADGGFPVNIGRQSLLDWIDQVLNHVSPFPKYKVRLVNKSEVVSGINADNVVFIVKFEESSDFPVMAPDLKYYLRLGAHSSPVNHFILEALRSKRFESNPKLIYKMRLDKRDEYSVVMDIINASNEPALNVGIKFEPDLPFFDGINEGDPVEVPIITKEHPFVMTIGFYSSADKDIGTNTKIILSYESNTGKQFKETLVLNPLKELPPVGNVSTSLDKIAESVGRIEKSFISFMAKLKGAE